MSGGIQRARLARRAHDRAARDQRDLRERRQRLDSSLGALERAPRLREEDVVERRLVQVDLGGAQALAVERADHVREVAVAVELHRARARARRRLARRSGRGSRRSAVALRARPRARPRPSACRSPPSAAAGVPSATIRPWSMIPTRSASTSASSRYCVVRKTVTPSSRASRADLLPERGAALRVEAGRRLVEEQDRRRRGSATAPGRAAASSRPSTSAPSGRRPRSGPTRVEQPRRSAPARLAPRIPCSEACSRRCSRPVRNGSSAVSCSAAPIAARTFGPSRTMS